MDSAMLWIAVPVSAGWPWIPTMAPGRVLLVDELEARKARSAGAVRRA